MNDEIKEILDYLKESAIKKNLYFEIKPEKAQILLDYITNLQQENEKLKVNCNLGYEELKVARDYKSRCEKAIEYIKKEKENYLTKGCLIADTNNANLIVSAAVNTCDCSLNILQNGSDDNE